MRPIPEELIEEVRSHFDLVEVVGRYVRLEKSGRNYFGLCPFHTEKTSSFSVSPEKQIFHCFGCGTGGDLFTFIQKIEGRSFLEAVQMLAEEAGILLPMVERESSQPDERAQLFEAYTWAARYYHFLLQHPRYGVQGRQYVEERGILPSAIQTFRLGYAPANRDALARFLLNKGFSPALLVKGGLLSPGKGNNSYYDKFRHRLIFPIQDMQGRVIAFGGRTLQNNQAVPKYLNSAESPIFHKGKTLFHLHRARPFIRQRNEVILMEGYMDVIAAVQAGVDHVVATLGTALTEEQARLLRRHAERVILCYDADQAGQNASIKGIELLRKAGCMVKVAVLPSGMDPDTYIREKGKESFLYDVLAQAEAITQFRLRSMRSRYDLSDPDGRTRYIRAALEVITELPLAIEREHYLRELSQEFQLSLESLKEDQRRIYYRRRREEIRASGDNPQGRWNNNPRNWVASAKLYPAYYIAERQLLNWMLKDASVIRRVQEEIGSRFNDDDHAALAAYIYAYYEAHQSFDLNSFVRQLRDMRMIELATSLAMREDAEHPAEEEIADYINEVLAFPKWMQLVELRQEMEKAERLQDNEYAIRLAKQIMELSKGLNPLQYRKLEGRTSDARLVQAGQLDGRRGKSGKDTGT